MEVECTVCLVTLSRSVAVHEHPRIGVAVCALCAEYLEEFGVDTDECAWCGEGGTLLCCDDCESSWCEVCLERHLGAPALEAARAAEVWRCPLCEPESLAPLARKLETARAVCDVGCEDAEGEDAEDEERTRRERARLALMRVESELCEALERLEDESCERVLGEISEELRCSEAGSFWTEQELGSKVELEMGEWRRLAERHLSLLELAHPAAQERAEAAGVSLSAFYVELAAADASGTVQTETACWRRAPKLASRKRGRVQQAIDHTQGLPRAPRPRRPRFGDTGPESSDDDASYTSPSDTEACCARLAADEELNATRRVRLTNGQLTGDCVGSNGFDQRRRLALTEPVFDALYLLESDGCDATAERLRATVGGDALLEDCCEITDIDCDWRTTLTRKYGAEFLQQVEQHELKIGAKATTKRIRAEDDDFNENKRRLSEARCTRRRRATLSSQCGAVGLLVSQRPLTDCASVLGSDHLEGRAPPRGHEESERAWDDFSDQHDQPSRLGLVKLETPGDVEERCARSQAAENTNERVVVPNSQKALALFWVPLEDRRELILQKLVRLGRASPDRPCSATIGSEVFVAVCVKENMRISRNLCDLRYEDGSFSLMRCAAGKTEVRAQRCVVPCGAWVELAFGEDSRSAPVQFANDGSHHVQGYLVRPRPGDGAFVLPTYRACDFTERAYRRASGTADARRGGARGAAEATTKEWASSQCATAAAARRGSGAAAHDPIVLEDSEELAAQLPALVLPTRRQIRPELEDSELCEDTLLAERQEREKRERLLSRQAKRRSIEGTHSQLSQGTSQHEPFSKPRHWSSSQVSNTNLESQQEEGEDFEEDSFRVVDGETTAACEEYEQGAFREGVAMHALDADDDLREGGTVWVPWYLGCKLKPHQVEAAKFLYDQTIESLEELEKQQTPQSETSHDPYGCVLAHSMGLGKTLTCIAFIASLLSHATCSRHVRTVLVVAPQNVVRNWLSEFRKWCALNDAALVKKVRVLDATLGSRAKRLEAVEAWQSEGGVAIIGFEFFGALVKDVALKPARANAPKPTLEMLAREGALHAGQKLVSVDGHPHVKADLLAGGVIAYKGTTFTTPGKFLKHALGPSKVNAWLKVTYKGHTLEHLRSPKRPTAPTAPPSIPQATQHCPMNKRFQIALQDPGPDLLILDEAHTINNPKTKRCINLSAVRTRRRVALTGTPLQNNLMEYHTMITYVRGPVLGSVKEFRNRFADPINNGMCTDSSAGDVKRMKRRTAVLMKLISDFVQRRDCTELAKEVDKTEYTIEVRLTPTQKRLYKAFLQFHRDRNGKMPSSFEAHQPLLRLGNHPATYLQAEDAATRSSPADNAACDAVTSTTTGDCVTTSRFFAATAACAASQHCATTTAAQTEERGPGADAAASSLEQLSFDKLNEGFEPRTCAVKKKTKKKKKRADEEEEEEEAEEEEDEEEEEGDEEEAEEEDARPLLALAAAEACADTSRRSGAINGEEDARSVVSSEGTAGVCEWSWLERVRAELDRDRGDCEDLALSNKTLLLFELLTRAFASGDKCVVFTQSLFTLDYIECVLQRARWGLPARPLEADAPQLPGAWHRGRDYFRIDGTVAACDRQREIESFEQDGTARLFLISTKAGNMGINLVSANRVVLFDSNWNPAIDRQALFRCYRFGQLKPVFVYRLITEGFEARLLKRAQQKELLSHRVVDDNPSDRIFAADDLVGLAHLDEEDEHSIAPCDESFAHVSDCVLRDALQAVTACKVSSAVVTQFSTNAAERLDEAEAADAEDDYEREVTGRPTREQEERLLREKTQGLEEAAAAAPRKDTACTEKERREEAAANDAKRRVKLQSQRLAHDAAFAAADKRGLLLGQQQQHHHLFQRATTPPRVDDSRSREPKPRSDPRKEPEPDRRGPQEALQPLPPGWKQFSRETDGRIYYHHEESKKTTWARP